MKINVYPCFTYKSGFKEGQNYVDVFSGCSRELKTERKRSDRLGTTRRKKILRAKTRFTLKSKLCFKLPVVFFLLAVPWSFLC